MKNLKYFPFERNRYFYGKFLSVDDFEAEQRYMNDKRRMLNRFLHGVGVVCGMQVVEVDDYTISLEAGMALDFSGREIVVASPFVKRLSTIDGFSKYSVVGEDRQDLYLCIAYDEYMDEPVHNITKANEEQEEEFNKYVEGYHLFVTSEMPEAEGEQMTIAYEETKTIYSGNGIKIRQKVPKYVRRNTEAEIEVFIEKTESVKHVTCSYRLKLTGLEQKGSDCITISFDENEFVLSNKYVIKSRVRAKTVANMNGVVEIVPDSFTLSIGEVSRKERVHESFKVRITDTELSETVLKNYYDCAMEDILQYPYGHAIYLARIHVIKAGDTYVIEEIENLPFRQCVWNHTLSAVMEAIRLRKTPVIEACSSEKQMDFAEKPVVVNGQEIQMKIGSTIIDLGIGGLVGQRFYSEEIVHGLGLGEVVITLGLAKGIQESNQVIYGSQGVFDDKICPNILMAAKVNMAKGSFVIGIKCLEQVEAKRLRVYWMAVKDKSVKADGVKNRHLEIRPDIFNMKVRESHYFEAVVGDEVLRYVKWSVKEADGGTIDANGCYTAPGQPGIYEIIAQSMEDGQLRAGAYVIVRESIS
ncbi:MAG: hypothetical protein K2L07_06900 [Lachnospiraceae bacterium]|nr:hypothetical protein [Lachnospiraceae bacterium]